MKRLNAKKEREYQKDRELLGLPISDPRISYSREDDILSLHTGEAFTDDTLEIGALMLDLDKKSNIVGFELFDASHRMGFILKMLNHALFDNFVKPKKAGAKKDSVCEYCKKPMSKHELRPEYLKILDNIEKGKFHRFKNFEEFKKIMREGSKIKIAQEPFVEWMNPFEDMAKHPERIPRTIEKTENGGSLRRIASRKKKVIFDVIIPKKKRGTKTFREKW